jgi:sugar O-acyltransferase (sialic acid O-acetyltransferase NeuD family)
LKTGAARTALGLLIFGAGGHGRVVADAAVAGGNWSRVIASDRNVQRCDGELLAGVALVLPDDDAHTTLAVHVAIGNAANREREVAALPPNQLVTVIHPAASVSPHAEVGPGCFIAAQAVVAAGAKLGQSVIVNHGAVVDHDVSVGEFSHIAPLAALGGAVRIGRRVLVGSNASIVPGVCLGDDIVVGAGAVVIADLPNPGHYAGVPARRLE